MAANGEPWKGVFDVVIGGRSHEILSYNDLSNFGPIDACSKVWAVRCLIGEIQDDEHWAKLKIPGDKHNVAKFCDLFGLRPDTVRSWIWRYRNRGFLLEGDGRPTLIDDDIMIDLSKTVQSSSKRLSNNDLVRLMIDCARRTLQRKGGSTVAQEKIQSISQATFSHYANAYSLKKRSGQIVFPEREKAIADKRLACSWVAVLMAVFGQLPAYKKWNSDQSMVGVEPAGTGMKVWISNEEEAAADDRLVVENHHVTQGNKIFLKYTCLGNADGQLSKLLVIVAVKEMPEDAFFVQLVKGLSFFRDVGSVGYLMFVKKRGGNPASNKWFHEGFIVPEISLADEDNKTLEFGSMKSAIYIDGESTILTAGMDPDVLSAYRNAGINGVKGVPSGTSKHQAWDVSSAFMSMHAGVAKVAKNNISVRNEALQGNLRLYLRNFDAQFPSVKLSESFKKQVIYACEVMTYVLQGKAITGEKVQKAFIKTGQHVEDRPSFTMPGFEQTTIDTRRILGQCSSQFSDEELASFESNLPNLELYCRTNGGLNDRIMDDLGIVRMPDHKSRDNLVLWRQPPVIFTHSEQEQNFAIWKRGKSPEDIEQQKKIAQAESLLVKQAAQEQRNNAKKEKAAQEKTRFNALTPAEKQAEKATKKEALEKMKAESSQKLQQDLADAKCLLDSHTARRAWPNQQYLPHGDDDEEYDDDSEEDA